MTYQKNSQKKRRKYQPTEEQKERRAGVMALIKKITEEWKAGMHQGVITFMDENYPQHSHYSELNRLLIFFQRPGADKADLATSAAWKVRGFHPSKGEHGIAIRAHHDEQGDDGAQGVGFHLIYLFDPSQVTPFDRDKATTDEAQEEEGQEDQAEEGETPQAQPEPERQPVTTAPAPARAQTTAPRLEIPRKASGSRIAALLEKREPVPADVLGVLEASTFTPANGLVLPYQLERKLYLSTNKTLERIGGKWDRRSKTHLFDEADPQELLQLILQTGEMPGKNPTAFFPTSQGQAARMAETIKKSARAILEPSAGTGRIARAIRDFCDWQKIEARLDCIEILPKFAAQLQAAGFTVVAADFLDFEGGPYDEIRMNPPFALEGDPLAYIEHVYHAWEILAEGGNLEAIVAGGFTFRQDKRVRELRELVEEHGSWQELPADAFKVKENGTAVHTALIKMHK